MTRSSVRSLWLILIAVMLIGLLVVFEVSSSISDSIMQQRSVLNAAQVELENTSRLSTALAELDRLTINENTATRLEILRHIGLEKDDYNVNIGGRMARNIGTVTLAARDVKITANLPYAEALALADKLYNNGKVNVTGVALANPNANYPNADVEITIEGQLFGIDKKGEH